MQDTSVSTPSLPLSRPSAFARSIALMKPVTWFAPSWAFLCGSIASGASQWTFYDISRIALGTLLAGPILCGLSQVINEYYDRDVDAINEPNRPIPAGLVSMRHVFVTIGVLAALAIGITLILGAQVALPVAVGLIFAVLYSVDPIRAKRNGWIGNLLVAVSYEGLPWLAGHLAFGPLTLPSVIMAALFSIGTHGIMTINDFKSIEGDRVLGIRTIPVQLGVWGATWTSLLTINVAQLFVIMTFLVWGKWVVAAIIGALFLAQIPAQHRFMQMEDPRARAIFYNASGIMLFVWGMMVAAIGLR